MSNDSESALSGERRDSLVLLLAWTAGSVDAMGFLGLNHVFTANMTGNTVLLGLTLGQSRALAAMPNVIALLGFGIGVALGALIVERSGKAGHWDRPISRAILLEGIMLAAFTALWHAGSHGEDRSSAVVYLLIAFSALAMGIQSAAVRRLNLPGVSTTYVTGTITTLIAGFVGRMRVAPARVSGGSAPSEPPAGIHQAALQAGVVVIYGLAAVISGLLQTRMPWLVGVTPPFAIAAVLLIIALSHRADESTHAARS